VVLENVLDDLNGLLNLFRRCVVGDRNIGQSPNVWSAGNVFDVEPCHLLIRNDGMMSGVQPNSCRSPSDFFNVAAIAFNLLNKLDIKRLEKNYILSVRDYLAFQISKHNQ